MYILADYELVYNTDSGYFEVEKDDSVVSLCPVCVRELVYRDKRLRIFKQNNGKAEHIKIHRLYCSKCDCLHNELPDCLVPYKHYGAEVVENVLDEVSTPEDLSTEDYPCEATMMRWKAWWESNRIRACGILASMRKRYHMPLPSLSDRRSLGSGWLCEILHMICNSGGRLECT